VTARGEHIQRAEALGSALRLLRAGFGEELRDPVAGEIRLQEDLAQEHDIAWSVPFNSRRYLEANDIGYAMVPSLIVVPKDGSPAHYAPSTKPLAEYLAAVSSGSQPWSGTDNPNSDASTS
jgi:immunity protein 35 of polymorphic toxin system